MTNEIEKVNTKFTPDGNQILEEIADGGGKTQKIKYGLIKLMGEKKEYRISYKTLLAINEAQNAKFKGKINIPEINMSVQVSQIVMMKSETENIRVNENFTSLPTISVTLDLDFNILNQKRIHYLKNKIDYYDAIVHYKEVDGIKQYLLEPDKIKRLLKVEFDKEGYDRVTEIYHYGIKQ